MIQRQIFVLLSLAIWLLLTACQPADPSTSTPAVMSGKLSTQHGKPGAPVSVNYQFPNNPLVDQPFVLNLEFFSTTAIGTLFVTVGVEGNLTLLADAQFSFDLAAASKTAEVPLAITNTEGGHVNLTIKEHDELGTPLLGRSYSIPIASLDQNRNKEVRTQELPSNSKMVETPEQKIIEMPAEIR